MIFLNSMFFLNGLKLHKNIRGIFSTEFTRFICSLEYQVHDLYRLTGCCQYEQTFEALSTQIV